MKNRLIKLMLVVVILTIGCTSSPAASTETSALNVVTTSNIVADWAKEVGGDRVEVFSLFPEGSDPHTFQPGARDVSRIADADIIFSVGLNLEGAWLRELVENAAASPDKVVALGDIVDPIEFVEIHDEHEILVDELNHVVHEVEEGMLSAREGLNEIEELLGGHENEHLDHDEDEVEVEVLAIIHDAEEGNINPGDAIEAIEGLIGQEHDHDDEDSHEHGPFDPHFWFDPMRVKGAVDQIASRLAALDSEGSETYLNNARAYGEDLDELHQWIQQETSQIPQERRLLVTSHESLGYFAEIYGFHVVGAVIGGGSTELEPSPQEMTELVEKIQASNAPALFTETILSDRLSQRIAEETGVAVVTGLHTGSLGGPGSGAESYIDFMRLNTQTIVNVLK